MSNLPVKNYNFIVKNLQPKREWYMIEKKQKGGTYEGFIGDKRRN